LNLPPLDPRQVRSGRLANGVRRCPRAAAALGRRTAIGGSRPLWAANSYTIPPSQGSPRAATAGIPSVSASLGGVDPDNRNGALPSTPIENAVDDDRRHAFSVNAGCRARLQPIRGLPQTAMAWTSHAICRIASHTGLGGFKALSSGSVGWTSIFSAPGHPAFRYDSGSYFVTVEWGEG
jgi:hypothetical protein